MKRILIFIWCFQLQAGFAQSLQLHYDLRHTFDPGQNQKNFPTLYFQYFKTLDSGKAFIKPGSFLLKMQADLTGEHTNIGKYYMQVSQEVRFWQPKVFLNIQYSGGLGVTEPKQYSYYIINAYAAGASYPFKIGSAYLSGVLNARYVAYSKPSTDAMYTLYFYKGLWNYKAELSGDFSMWTENRNHGDELTIGQHGKQFFFYAEPQFWYCLAKKLAVGTRINVYYHVLTNENNWQVYPTLGVSVKL